MAELIIRVGGFARGSVGSDWEIHVFDGTLSDLFSGMIDGKIIDRYKIDQLDDSIVLHWTNDWSIIPVGQTINYSDMAAGNITLEFIHGLAPFGTGYAKFTATGEAKYAINFSINSMV